MRLSLQIYGVKPNSAVKSRISSGSLKSAFSILIEEAKAFFSRRPHNACPACASPSAVIISNINQKPRTFVAMESFKRGDDVTIFNSQIYKWRDWFNVPPTLIALRDISSGEEVVSNPSDLESSDLLIHWGLTHNRESGNSRKGKLCIPR